MAVCREKRERIEQVEEEEEDDQDNDDGHCTEQRNQMGRGEWQNGWEPQCMRQTAATTAANYKLDDTLTVREKEKNGREEWANDDSR